MHAHYFSERTRIKETLSPLTNFYRITFFRCLHTLLALHFPANWNNFRSITFAEAVSLSLSLSIHLWHLDEAVEFFFTFYSSASHFFLASSFFIFHFYTYVKCAFFRFLSYVGVHAFKIHIWTQGKKFYSILDEGIISSSSISMRRKNNESERDKEQKKEHESEMEAAEHMSCTCI